MDLSAIVPNEVVHDVLHPVTKKAIGLKVTLISQDDERVKRITRGIKDDNNRRRAAGKSITSEREDDQNMEVLIACVTGWTWEGDANFEGEKPEYNDKNARKVFGKLEWLKDQIVAVVNDPTHFLPG